MKIQLQVIIALILTVLLSVGLTFGINHYMRLRDAAQQGQIDKGKLGTIEAVVPAIEKADTERQRVEVVVSSARETFQQTKQEAIRNEPETRSRADRPVPASVRNAYRERRLARERSNGDAKRD